MKARVLVLAFALLVLPRLVAAFPVTVLEQNGPIDRRFNVAVLGDGYRTDDQAKLETDAKNLLADIFDALPYASYRGLFNVKLIQAVSNDRGADNGTAGGTVDTAFDANFSCDGVSRLLCVNDKKVLAAAMRDVPEFNLALVIVNDTKYGGSGGDVPCVSTNRQAAEVIRHELGHNLANLADEYETPYPGYKPCSPTSDCLEPNVTLRNMRAQIKWVDWILPATPIPTPENTGGTGVGLFEGARYLSSGVYRPVDNSCKMLTLGKPFCSVCSEGLVRAFWDLPNVHLVDGATPPGDVQDDQCGSTIFSVTTPTVTPSTLAFVWSIDGQAQATTTSSLTVAAGTLANGRHNVIVTVKDATMLVRTDPQHVLQEDHSWGLTSSGCSGDASTPPPPVDAGSGGADVRSMDVLLDRGSVDGNGGGGGPADAGRPDGNGTGTVDSGAGGSGAGGAGGAGPGGGSAGGGATGGMAGRIDAGGGSPDAPIAIDGSSDVHSPRPSPPASVPGCACRIERTGSERLGLPSLGGWALGWALLRARRRRAIALNARPRAPWITS